MKPATILVLSLILACCWVSTAGAEPTAAELELFEKRIRPVLIEHCHKCHSADAKKPKGGLLLDSRAGLLKGGESGPAVVPGQPDRSKLIGAVRYGNVDLQMPPRARLPDSVIADLTAWVKQGAPWPTESGPKTGADKYVLDLAKRKREHWVWRPIDVGKVPQVKNSAWPTGAIDRYILARLEDRGLSPAAPADPRTLMRRLSFDLIGLPPSPEEVASFVKDWGQTEASQQAALEKVVDRLLASPHVGERWGRHWLDLVRYAESRGHEFDYNLPNAYQYRDYVVRALNADVPYDQFVIEHLAGDLLSEPRLHPAERFNESILGTGFWFLGEQVHSPVDICQDKADRQDNMIDVMTKTFLGLTVACARCHDHKFDAISTKDYYALAGFLESSGYRLARFDSMPQERAAALALEAVRCRHRLSIQKAFAESLRPGLERMADYLLAAHEGMSGEAVEAIAARRKLDAKQIAAWTAHLRQVAKNATDPLHAFAVLAGAPADPKRVAEVIRRLANGSSSQLRMKAEDVIIDYGHLHSDNWIQDGYAFGCGPVYAGSVQLGMDVARPIVKVHHRAAAARDVVWDRLKLSAGAENEPGALGSLVRAGRTLRTPTFTVTTGKVHYLVRGAGLAYVGVDGHVMIAGPLHGRLVQHLKTGSDFMWVSHDTSRYKGSRARIEFTPAEGADFAVAMVLQGDAPSTTPAVRGPLPSFAGTEISLEALARFLQGSLQQAAEQLSADRCQDASAARLADWLAGHAPLFQSAASLEKLAEVAGPFLLEQARLLERRPSASRLAPAMLDGSGVDEHVFIRGAYKTPGEVVPRRFLETLAGAKPLPVARGSGRLELARQMTDPAVTPFVPRVLVNRIWHHLFGRGIVASVDNFGVLGEAPTHPELLDFLADQFVKEGWSTRKLIRSLVLTRTYRMSSEPDERAGQADPQNLLLQHMRVRRLEGEAIRDAILQVSGRLERTMFGPSVPVYLTPFQEGRGRPGSGPLDGNGRRSIYLSVRRNFLPAMLLAFDTPIPFSTVGRRTVSNVPAQALILLNDPFVHQQAGVWAQRVLAQGGSPQERITNMYLAAFNRPADEAELNACLEFLARQGRLTNPAPAELALWTDLAHALFNAKEFIFVK